MNVNEKGARGLIKVIDNLHENSYYAFPAFDDYSPIDLIAVGSSKKAIRLQVKYRSRNENGVYGVAASTVSQGKKKLIDKSMIDGWAIYLAEDNKVVYIPKTIFIKIVSLLELTIRM